MDGRMDDMRQTKEAGFWKAIREQLYRSVSCCEVRTHLITCGVALSACKSLPVWSRCHSGLRLRCRRSWSAATGPVVCRGCGQFEQPRRYGRFHGPAPTYGNSAASNVFRKRGQVLCVITITPVLSFGRTDLEVEPRAVSQFGLDELPVLRADPR